MPTEPADNLKRVEELLDLWARWNAAGGHQIGFGSLTSRYAHRDALSSSPRLPTDPAFDQLMIDVGKAVAELPPIFRRIVLDHHSGRANIDHQQLSRRTHSAAAQAAEIGCAVSTFYRRLRAAYATLATMPAFQRAGVHMKREN